MHSYFITLLIICSLVFCAGFVDAVAGGGGLISLPAYIFAGVPIHTAYGTNKFTNWSTFCNKKRGKVYQAYNFNSYNNVI